GRTVRQIRGEAALRDAIEAYLDANDLTDRTPDDVRRALREHLAGDEQLQWALEPADRPALGERVKDTLHLVAIPLVTLPFVPLLLLGAPFFAVILRVHEKRDPAPHVPPSEEVVTTLAALEDHVVQNPFTALGLVKPSFFRRVTLRVILFY